MCREAWQRESGPALILLRWLQTSSNLGQQPEDRIWWWEVGPSVEDPSQSWCPDVLNLQHHDSYLILINVGRSPVKWASEHHVLVQHLVKGVSLILHAELNQNVGLNGVKEISPCDNWSAALVGIPDISSFAALRTV